MRLVDAVASATRCAGCGREGEELCVWCARRLRVLRPPWCDRCGTPSRAPCSSCEACRDLEGFGRARSLVSFADPARSLTLALKRRGSGEVARAVGTLLGALAERGRSADVVTYVPAGRRARGKGFDHAELLARGVARWLGAPVRRWVYRRDVGPRQSDVSLTDRRTNARSRFASRRASGAVLLVDDVFTTGATVEACAVALLDAGAASVDAVTWARTLRRFPRGDTRILVG